MSNFNEFVLMTHVGFGMLCILSALWAFVDTLNADATNQARIRKLCFYTAIFMWLSFIIGGYWYVVFYKVDKAVILKGPWPFAHKFFMEMKEHVILALLLLTTYLPIAASNNLLSKSPARTLVLWTTGLIVILGIVMDGSGAIIGLGAKLGLMTK